MIRPRMARIVMRDSIPRESGDDPLYLELGLAGGEYSPRERG